MERIYIVSTTYVYIDNVYNKIKLHSYNHQPIETCTPLLVGFRKWQARIRSKVKVDPKLIFLSLEIEC